MPSNKALLALALGLGCLLPVSQATAATITPATPAPGSIGGEVSAKQPGVWARLATRFATRSTIRAATNIGRELRRADLSVEQLTRFPNVTAARIRFSDELAVTTTHARGKTVRDFKELTNGAVKHFRTEVYYGNRQSPSRTFDVKPRLAR